MPISVNSFVLKPSSLRIGPRLRAQYELNTNVTSVNVRAFQRQIKRRIVGSATSDNFGSAALSVRRHPAAVNSYNFFTRKSTIDFSGYFRTLMRIEIEITW